MPTAPPLPEGLFNCKPPTLWQRDIPYQQPFYYFNTIDSKWTAASSTSEISNPNSQPTSTSQIRLLTWNIDALVPYDEQRMASALKYLGGLYHDLQEKATSSHNPPLVMFFQEMLGSDLRQIQETDWIRQNFYVTDLNDECWESGYYGTTTLVEKRLDVQRVFRVHYKATRMQRDGLFVDLDVQPTDEDKPTILRLCNTHLESLTQNPPRRPIQLRIASTYMHGSGPPDQESTSSLSASLPTPHAALLAGDLNAFAPEDLAAPVECGLDDAFLSLGGKDGTEEGYTWGQQVSDDLRKKFGCSRMDKILFCGALKAEKLQRIGEGIKAYVGDVLESDSDDSEPMEQEMDVSGRN
ncbi:endonuclease/exonuclease/phosphatase family protein [Paecilomyces variotii No. 5]|uniref:Endonuclease/exonuclease/phosphatase family protein n=1 Tax=Byssochlamys spectabilis (strain No. 5 / NBRC 109023) TaxID=1356009 RepID=V5I0S3_BYSSN|nr:endonuclease/exonuclease/phosphatase family protein [Paecilomyces variotii No. 5]